MQHSRMLSIITSRTTSLAYNKFQDGDGTCQSTADCTSQGFNLANYCPGADDIQCCVKKACSTSSGSGICLNSSDTCGGSFVSGACPGDSSIQVRQYTASLVIRKFSLTCRPKCCVSSADGTPTPSTTPSPPTSGGSGQSLVDAAVKEEGLPYVWGGGGCDGPSGGGFDCSGTSYLAHFRKPMYHFA